MKAKLFVAALATLAFASCSETETVEMPSSATIKFDNAFISNSVRAAIGGVDDLTSFYVFGGFDNQYSNVYNNTAVAREGEKPSYTWRPEYTAYWQIDKVYTFDAYAANAKIDGATCDANGVNFSKAVTVDGTNDIIVAAADDVTVNAEFLATPKPVALTFKHTLSQVKFSFATTLENVDITISNVKINNVQKSGKYANALWTAEGEAGSYDFTAPVAAVTNTAAGETNALILMPQALGESVTLTFTVNTTGAIKLVDKELSVKFPVDAIDMLEGHSYDFKATLTAENIDPSNPLKPIQFTVSSVDGWANEAESGLNE